MSNSLRSQGLYSPWNPPGQNIGVGSLSPFQGIFPIQECTREAQEYWRGSLSLLQGIFPTQELDWGLLHCRQILYQLSSQRREDKARSPSTLHAPGCATGSSGFRRHSIQSSRKGSTLNFEVQCVSAGPGQFRRATKIQGGSLLTLRGQEDTHMANKLIGRYHHQSTGICAPHPH